MNTEIWKTIPFNENYEVSNLGKVRSKDHYFIGKNGKQILKIGRVLKTDISKKGYIRVTITKNTKRFNTGLHRLIAICFIPNPLNKPQVNHINGIKTDNRIENLEWCTNKENQIHAVKNNLCNPNYCENHHNAKLTNKDVLKVRELHKIGFTNSELAKDYGVSKPAMSKILRNKTYINIK